MERAFPSLERRNLPGLVNCDIEEVQPDTSLTDPFTFAAVLTVRDCFVAFQMALSAGEATRAYPARFRDCR